MLTYMAPEPRMVMRTARSAGAQRGGRARAPRERERTDRRRPLRQRWSSIGCSSRTSVTSAVCRCRTHLARDCREDHRRVGGQELQDQPGTQGRPLQGVVGDVDATRFVACSRLSLVFVARSRPRAGATSHVDAAHRRRRPHRCRHRRRQRRACSRWRAQSEPIRAVTNERGEATFEMLPQGRYAITAEAAGFAAEAARRACGCAATRVAR